MFKPTKEYLPFPTELVVAAQIVRERRAETREFFRVYGSSRGKAELRAVRRYLQTAERTQSYLRCRARLANARKIAAEQGWDWNEIKADLQF